MHNYLTMTADVNLRYLARSKIYKILFDHYIPINHLLTRDPLVMMIVESYKIDPLVDCSYLCNKCKK
jgi:hypothetical protein